MNFFVCLLDYEGYDRGDSLCAEPGEGPPNDGWASFDPPAGLSGIPHLLDVEDPGTGNLTFRYSIEGVKKHLVLKARIGISEAIAGMVSKRHDREGPDIPKPVDKPQLQFGAGLVATESRSLIHWVPGGGRPTPTKKPPDPDPPLTLNLPSYNAWNTE